MSSQQTTKAGNQVTSRTIKNSANNTEEQGSFMDQALDIVSQPLVAGIIAISLLSAIGSGVYLMFFRLSPLEKNTRLLKVKQDTMEAARTKLATLRTLEGKGNDEEKAAATKNATEAQDALDKLETSYNESKTEQDKLEAADKEKKAAKDKKE